MTDKLWLLPFGPDQIHLPTLHSPDSGGFLMPASEIARGFVNHTQFCAGSIMFADDSYNQHAIPVGEETVALFDSFSIGL